MNEPFLFALLAFFTCLLALSIRMRRGLFLGLLRKPEPPSVYPFLYPEPPKTKPKIRWSKGRVLREVGRLYGKGIFPSLAYVAHRKPELLEAGGRFFGPWENVLVAAGLICFQPEPDMFYDHEIGVWAHDSLTAPINRHPFIP